MTTNSSVAAILPRPTLPSILKRAIPSASESRPYLPEDFVFDPEVALKTATSAVAGLSSAWNRHIQDADMKEIIAQAVAKAWDRRDLFDPCKASFRTWVGRIARNCLLDHYRKTVRKEEGDFGARQETAKAPDVLMMEDEGLNAVIRAVEELPESHRDIITLLSEGKRTQEIARILGCTPNAASIRCFRARKALRKKLADLL